jgi:chaperonin GroEL
MEGLKERLARLSGGIATIYVGALTPTEKEEKCAAILDAQNSVAGAIKYGILPGGGTALLKTAQYLSEKPHNFETEAIRKGYEAVLSTMRSLAKRLVGSVKPDDYQYIVQQIAHEKDFWTGYNVRTEKIEDLKKAQVIDSAAIELFVLQYSASEIGAFIVSDGVIVNANCNVSYDMNDRKVVEAYK